MEHSVTSSEPGQCFLLLLLRFLRLILRFLWSSPHWRYWTVWVQSCAMCSGMTLPEQEDWIRWPSVVPSNIAHSVILWDAGDYGLQYHYGGKRISRLWQQGSPTSRDLAESTDWVRDQPLARAHFPASPEAAGMQTADHSISPEFLCSNSFPNCILLQLVLVWKVIYLGYHQHHGTMKVLSGTSKWAVLSSVYPYIHLHCWSGQLLNAAHSNLNSEGTIYGRLLFVLFA